MKHVILGLVLLVLVGGIVLLAVGSWAVSVNNGLARSEQNVNEKWAQVQTVYQRRLDLIPGLEESVLTEVTQARSRASGVQLTPEALNDPKAMERFAAAQAQLSGALSRLLVTVEKYPELKSNQNFMQFNSQLEGTENRIAVERRRYNEAVKDYNTRLVVFPDRVVASFGGFKPKAYFEAVPEAATAPKVKF